MRHNIIYVLLGIIALASISIAYHVSIIASPVPNSAEYQITLEEDGAAVYDGQRYVGYLPYDSTSAFDKLMNKDNE